MNYGDVEEMSDYSGVARAGVSVLTNNRASKAALGDTVRDLVKFVRMMRPFVIGFRCGRDKRQTFAFEQGEQVLNGGAQAVAFRLGEWRRIRC